MKALLQYLLVAGCCTGGFNAIAGGSALNLVVVVNQASTNSVELGNYYCEQRHVPPQNLLRVNWPGGTISWTKTDFESVLLQPLLGMLAARRLTNQVDYVLLSMDFPYKVENAGSATVSGNNSTTSALFYGFKTDYPPAVSPASCSLSGVSSNSYAGSEGIFRQTPPVSAASNSFLVAMITASNLVQAKWIVDRGAASDGTFPTQTVYLAKSEDTARNFRYNQFDNVIFNTRLRGNYSVQRTNVNASNFLGPLLGYQNGYQNGIPTTNYVPGALADQLTSYGGEIFDQADHTTALNYISTGAAGSYGTIIEPCAYVQKFPSSQIFFYQSRGFNMAECYYQGVTNPYQGLIMGDPLSAPFAQPPAGAWTSVPGNPLSGSPVLGALFTGSDALHPVQTSDLFVDGVYARTITNVPPWTNNVLAVTINGFPTNFTVPAGATLRTIVNGFVARLNTTTYSNATKVAAIAHGDRIELQSLDPSRSADQLSLSASGSAGTAPVLSSFATVAGPGFLDTVASGIRSFSFTGSDPAVGAYLQLSVTKTDNSVVTLAITNTVSGATLATLAQGLLGLVNTAPDLQGVDGLVMEDFISYSPATGQPYPQFNLRARASGWAAAQIRATLTASAGITPQPSGAQRLDQNVADLRPRAHIYVCAGLTNLPLSFAFNTLTQADGWHDLTLLACDGTHVRSQRLITRPVWIQNSSLSATLTTLLGASNTLLSATLAFSVVANTNNVSNIELFSTGGSLTNVTGLSSVVFYLPGSALGAGLHPVYAVVTAGGKQFRTATQWIRLGYGAEPAFTVAISNNPPVLSWQATAGRGYDVLGTTNIGFPFAPLASLIASNSPASWTDTNSASQRFYRIRTAD